MKMTVIHENTLENKRIHEFLLNINKCVSKKK